MAEVRRKPRSPNGEQIVISNANLLKERISNYKRLHERRVLFTLKVVYQTKKEHLKAIPVILKDIISTKPSTRFDRAHFSEYGESSLNFEVVYYITDPDYILYMNVQQDIYLEIYERFEQENIEFAHPSYTVYPKWPKAFSGSDETQAFAGFPPQARKTLN